MLEDLLKGNFISGGEPFYNKVDTDLGVLMLHGLTATPDQVRELGNFLYDKGISNFGCRIAGHATKKEDLIKTTRKDWLASARIAYEEFNSIHKKTIVLGFSLGGLLALNLASEYIPPGVITIATPYKFNYKCHLQLLAGFYKTKNEDIRYPGNIPVKSMYEIVRLAKETKKVTPSIKSPVLIIQGDEDKRVSIKAPFEIYDNVKSKHKDVLLFSGEEHHILKGKYKKEIFDRIYEFITQTI